MANAFLSFVSATFGWIYFLAWSLSFYPQVILNWNRKTVEGLSFDFLNYNFLGFFSYSIFNAAFFWNKTVQAEYFAAHPGTDDIPVQANDVAFALQALAITTFTIFQCFIYKKGPNNVNSILCMSLVTTTWLVIYVLLILSCLAIVSWLDYMYFFSYVKLGVTLVKYVPQAYMNWYRKSTLGWSIYQVLLDFTGGIFSIAQSFLDAINNDDWSYFTGNWTKFLLAIFSLVFDVIFMTQHYILYPTQDNTPWRVSWNQSVDDLLSCKGVEGFRAALKFNVQDSHERDDDALLYTPPTA